MNVNTFNYDNSRGNWPPPRTNPHASTTNVKPPKLVIRAESDQHLRALVKRKAAQGDYLEAIAILTRLLQKNPQSAVDYNNRGLMLSKNGQDKEAITDFDRALAINPRLDGAYNNRGNSQAALGNLALAIADYQRAIDYNPTNLKAWINLGIAFRQLGLYDLALENFDLSLLFSKHLQGRIYAERGKTYHSRGDYNCAIADYNRALKLLPANKQCSYREKVQSWLNSLLYSLSA